MGLSLGGGKSKGSSNSSSSNVNNGMLTSSLGPATQATGQATGLMSTMLNGGPGGFADSGGFKFLMNQGTQDVNSNMASRGLLNSGADMKGLEDYRGGLAQTFLDKYLGHVNEMGQLGIGAGGVLSNSGDVSSSNSKQKSKNASVGLSDRRLKKDIEKLGEYEDGLGKYGWTYVEGLGLPEGRHEGVMADEVKALRPWAHVSNYLGSGYDAVDYGSL